MSEPVPKPATTTDTAPAGEPAPARPSAPEAAEQRTPPEPSLEGKVFELGDEATRDRAVELAFDYRGDVTLHLADGSTLVGYVYDRGGRGGERYVRVIPASGGERRRLAVSGLRGISFTGRDTAFGKSWEAWARKYSKLKSAGKEASLYGEETA
jgi:hypothetical protein